MEIIYCTTKNVHLTKTISIGKCLMKMNKPTKAIDHFQKSLEIQQRLSSDSQNNRNLSVTLCSLGECLIKMDKPIKQWIIFKNHLKSHRDYQGLRRTTEVCFAWIIKGSAERQKFTLHSIGKCLMKMNKPTKAMDHLQKSLEGQQQLAVDLQNHRSLLVALRYIGECLMKINKPYETIDHFQKSLKI